MPNGENQVQPPAQMSPSRPSTALNPMPREALDQIKARERAAAPSRPPTGLRGGQLPPMLPQIPATAEQAVTQSSPQLADESIADQTINYSVGDGPALDPLEMGINAAIFQRLSLAAVNKKCVIIIRKTNKGSVTYFEKGTGVGKKLPTKGKSSESYFTQGSIPFLADMAKKVKNWYYEQTTLIEVTTFLIKEKNSRAQSAKYTYIPKLISLQSELLNGNKRVGTTLTPQQSGKITVILDKIGGREIENVDYFLKKVKFSDVSRINGIGIAKPDFIENDHDECYQVYISKNTIDAIPIGAIAEKH